MQFLKHVVVYMQHVWIIKYSSDCMYKHYRNEKADVVWTANPEKKFSLALSWEKKDHH